MSLINNVLCDVLSTRGDLIFSISASIFVKNQADYYPQIQHNQLIYYIFFHLLKYHYIFLKLIFWYFYIIFHTT